MGISEMMDATNAQRNAAHRMSVASLSLWWPTRSWVELCCWDYGSEVSAFLVLTEW